MAYRREQMAAARALKDQAARAMNQRSFKRAISAYDELIKLEPHEPHYYLKLGEAYRQVGELPQAVEAFHNAAQAFVEADHVRKAVGACKLVLEIEPDNRRALRVLDELDELNRLAGRRLRDGVPGAPIVRIGGARDETPAPDVLRPVVKEPEEISTPFSPIATPPPPAPPVAERPAAPIPRREHAQRAVAQHHRPHRAGAARSTQPQPQPYESLTVATPSLVAAAPPAPAAPATDLIDLAGVPENVRSLIRQLVQALVNAKAETPVAANAPAPPPADPVAATMPTAPESIPLAMEKESAQPVTVDPLEDPVAFDAMDIDTTDFDSDELDSVQIDERELDALHYPSESEEEVHTTKSRAALTVSPEPSVPAGATEKEDSTGWIDIPIATEKQTATNPATNAIDDAADVAELEGALLDFARTRSARAVLLRIQGALARGWRSVGIDPPDVIRRVVISLDEPSTFQNICDSGRIRVGPLSGTATDQQFLLLTGERQPHGSMLVPVFLSNRVAYILYMDHAMQEAAAADTAELLMLSESSSRAIERIFWGQPATPSAALSA